MNVKIRVALAAVAAVVGACAFTAAPGYPAARAVIHHAPVMSPSTGFTQDRVCDLESTQLCMSGDTGGGQPVTGVSSGTADHLNMNEFVVTQNCNSGKVSDGAPGEGAPCPFTSGSGLNTEFNNDSIVQLVNFAGGKFYAAFMEPFGWGVIEIASGNGQIWVQQGDLSGTSPNAVFVNVEASNSDSQADIICTHGDGQQLRVSDDNGNPPSTCRWYNAGPA